MIKLDVKKMRRCHRLTKSGSEGRARNLHLVSVGPEGYVATNGNALIFCPGGPAGLEEEHLVYWGMVNKLQVSAARIVDRQLEVDYSSDDISGVMTLNAIQHGTFVNWKKSIKPLLEDLKSGNGTSPVMLNPRLLEKFTLTSDHGVSIRVSGETGIILVFPDDETSMHWAGMIMPLCPNGGALQDLERCIVKELEKVRPDEEEG